MTLQQPAAVHLPLSFWLVVALCLVVAVPSLTVLGLTQLVDHLQNHAEAERSAAIQRIVGNDVSQWQDTAWQARTTSALRRLDVEAGLVDKRDRLLAFTTSGGADLMSAAMLAPLPASATVKSSPGGDIPSFPRSSNPLTYQKLVIYDPAHPQTVIGVANLWYSARGAAPPGWLVWAGGLLALLLTLAALAYLIQRSLLRPLARLSLAAELIQQGELAVPLIPSRAVEVARVVTAFATMRAGLAQAAREQERLEAERRFFLGAVTHDLRTPLFTLSAHLNGLRDGVAATPDKVEHYLAVCLEQAAMLDRLINDLFSLTRLDVLEQAPRRERLDLARLLPAIVEPFRAQAEDAGITLCVSVPDEPSPVQGDRQLLTRAFANLIANALQHSSPGGRIALNCRPNPLGFLIMVEDSGPGIADHDLPYIFDPLYRGEGSRNRQSGGAGLGLSVARSILQAHGGDLSAANRPESGAVFTARLPRSDED